MAGDEPVWETITWLSLGVIASLMFLLSAGLGAASKESFRLPAWVITNFALSAIGFITGSVGAYMIWRIDLWVGELSTLLPYVVSLGVAMIGHFVVHQTGDVPETARIEYTARPAGILLVVVAAISAGISTIFGWPVDTTAGILLLVYTILLALSALVAAVFYPHQYEPRSGMAIMRTRGGGGGGSGSGQEERITPGEQDTLIPTNTQVPLQLVEIVATQHTIQSSVVSPQAELRARTVAAYPTYNNA